MGSEMCIRDSFFSAAKASLAAEKKRTASLTKTLDDTENDLEAEKTRSRILNESLSDTRPEIAELTNSLADAKTDLEAETLRADEAVAALAVCRAMLPNEDDGRVAGVDQCFMDGGDCASCCGACVKTTDTNNDATTETCVCYEADTAPVVPFYGTENNDCVFIKAKGVRNVNVRNQCLESAEEEVLAPPRRGR